MLSRICYIKDSMLWARAVQWLGAMHNGVEFVLEQRHLRVLGRIPPVGEGQQNHRRADDGGRREVHAPHESQHHRSP